MGDFFATDRTLRDLGWPHIVHAWAAHTATRCGRDRALHVEFLHERRAIELSFGRIEELRALLRAAETVPLGGVEDVRPALGRAAKQAVLSPAELLACARLISATVQVRAFMVARRERLPLTVLLAQQLPERRAVADAIDAAIEPSGALRDGASAVLAELRQRTARLHHAIKTQIEAMVREPLWAPNLQDSYFSVRGERYVLPVDASFQAKVPGIVHNVSQSGQTLFIEPQQLVPLGNELALATALAAAEEQRILAHLSAALGAEHATWYTALDLLAKLDCVQAAALLADRLGAQTPSIADPVDVDVDGARASLQLRQLRHPRLLLQGTDVIANEVMLGVGAAARGLVLSGPNAGGKTATLTAVGLCALMVRAGLPIPADGASTVPLFAGVCCAIGDAQDLEGGLSTFAAHLAQLQHMLGMARAGWLVLIDEIAADTDPQEGAALARATLEELVEQQALVLVTTHLEELKALGMADPRFINARVGVHATTLQPTYRLESGAAGASNALAVAAQRGLPPRVVQRAQEYLRGSGLLATALSALQARDADLVAARAAVGVEQTALATLRRELETAQLAAVQAQHAARREIYASLATEMAAIRTTVGEMIAALQAKPEMRRAQDVQRHVAQVENQLRARDAAPPAWVTAPRAPSLELGMWVHVEPLGQEGEILQLTATSALVALGSMRSRFARDTLQPVARPPSAKQRPHRFAGDLSGDPDRLRAAAPPAADGGRCDVRGLRVEAALRVLEQALDASFGEGAAMLVVVHGIGTGVLCHAVREALGRSPYVAEFRAGDSHEGGAGVTVVRLGST